MARSNSRPMTAAAPTTARLSGLSDSIDTLAGSASSSGQRSGTRCSPSASVSTWSRIASSTVGSASVRRSSCSTSRGATGRPARCRSSSAAC
ncbi:hypothetical protein ACFQY4_02465 [Catellatospora bangladeshensis]|uniref:hypothetical protein n=1 Tax=Catellatospora bangladeshensis TaxID=310355 RepID=UPI003617D15D